jgi:hypothetical protein
MHPVVMAKPGTGRGRALARKGRPVKVEVTIDPVQKKRFDDLRAVLSRSRREEAEGFDAYWEAVGEILDKGLYVAGGYATADAFLAKEVTVPRRTALRLVRVAKYASPDEEQRYGTAVLDAALGYIEAITGGPIEGKLPIAFDKLRFEVERDGETTKLALGEVTLDEIRRSTSEKLRGSKKSRAHRSPHETALAGAIAKVAALKGALVRVSSGKLRVTGVPLEAIPALAKVLADTRLPAGKEAVAAAGAPSKKTPAGKSVRARAARG